MTDSEEPEMLPCPRRGRPRVRRIIEGTGESRCYKPCCCLGEENEGISLKPEEIELIRLIDLEGLEQEEAAEDWGSRARPHGGTCTKPGARLQMLWSTGKESRWPAAQKQPKAGARSAPGKLRRNALMDCRSIDNCC